MDQKTQNCATGKQTSGNMKLIKLTKFIFETLVH